MIRAILFDIGGPINTEVKLERQLDADIRAELTAEGFAVDDAAYDRACRFAVDSFSPNAYQAIIWHLTNRRDPPARQVYDVVWRRARTRMAFELREGIPQLLAHLRARGLRLGLAANQSAAVIGQLDSAGIGHYFQHREVSGMHGFQKPDPRLFLRACDDLGVELPECVMVGDRIDNDIGPAGRLGMRTVLFRTGRHISQLPRSWEEIPDAEVHGVYELRQTLLSYLD
ncbi:MAG: HAD family hydrolase [Chloroflexota bacterium]|nr:HAD family hydrolase [Chloroflexota bacterium]